jgi:hypothetical protein
MARESVTIAKRLGRSVAPRQFYAVPGWYPYAE